VVLAFKQVRKIIRYGKSSSGIVLPREWTDYYGLGHGSEVVILANDVLIIVPKHLEQKARRLIEGSTAETG
jgi:bifunctional DNA-binding transcriptional regulator/antitoxin component of YhaV-PrlF toxin-antitoxin module